MAATIRPKSHESMPFARPRSIEMSYAPDFVTMTQRLRELIIANRPQKEAA